MEGCKVVGVVTVIVFILMVNGLVPHAYLHGRGEVAGDARESTALWDPTEEVCGGLSYGCHYRDSACKKFLSFEFHIPLDGASKEPHSGALVFQGYAVKVAFLVILADGDVVSVFDGILDDCLFNGRKVCTTFARPVGVHGGRKDLGFLRRNGKVVL